PGCAGARPSLSTGPGRHCAGAGNPARGGWRTPAAKPGAPAGPGTLKVSTGWREEMPPLRSRTVTHGRNMAGARALLRATGVAREDLGKPIIAVANSFTEFVPGHVHLREVGQVVADAVRAA